MPSASLGASSPLPALKPYSSASSGDSAYERYLPYRTQDTYDRVKVEQRHKVAILENDRLRAMFLLNIGGRLWSLFHKRTHRELLMCNPVFQPANLAIRNAWFSGGIEWNVSKFGHCPFTCSPVHAARIEGPNGEPVLRIYEYERCRDVPFQIDFYLPDGSDFLFSSPRITNPHEHKIPMYWWSNIAVVESPSTRVLAPADEALGHDYDESGVRMAKSLENNDLTYPARWPSAIDLYFVIPEGRRPWEAAIEAGGRGLVHLSSPQLFGRKMFVWGMSEGGRRWQEFLSEPGSAYFEIQGGLTRTQSEYVRMPASTSWQWLEAFGPVEVDPAEVFGDWGPAWRAVDAATHRALPASDFEAASESLRAIQKKSPSDVLNLGSGGATSSSGDASCLDCLIWTSQKGFTCENRLPTGKIRGLNCWKRASSRPLRLAKTRESFVLACNGNHGWRTRKRAECATRVTRLFCWGSLSTMLTKCKKQSNSGTSRTPSSLRLGRTAIWPLPMPSWGKPIRLGNTIPKRWPCSPRNGTSRSRPRTSS